MRKTSFSSAFFNESRAAFALIGLNIFAFLFFVFHPDLLSRSVLYPGALLSGRYWTPLTSGFVHHDPAHLGMNMLGILIFGRIVQIHLGAAKTFFIYFGSLALSLLFSTLIYAFVLHRDIAIIGASGAVMGLMAAAILLDPFCVTYEMLLPLPVMVKGWMFIYADIRGFLGGENDGISHLAHLCGFMSVALLVYFLSAKDKRLMRSGLIVNVLSFIGFMFLYTWLNNRSG